MLLQNGIVKQEGFLRDETDLFAQRFLGQAAQILAIDADRARGRIIEPQDEGQNRALARAARADERIGFAGLDRADSNLSRHWSHRWRSGTSRHRTRSALRNAGIPSRWARPARLAPNP